MTKEQQAFLASLVAECTQLAAEERANRTQLDTLQQRVETLEALETALHAVGHLAAAAVGMPTVPTERPQQGEHHG
jgi:hypothetical protein